MERISLSINEIKYCRRTRANPREKKCQQLSLSRSHCGCFLSFDFKRLFYWNIWIILYFYKNFRCLVIILARWNGYLLTIRGQESEAIKGGKNAKLISNCHSWNTNIGSSTLSFHFILNCFSIWILLWKIYIFYHLKMIENDSNLFGQVTVRDFKASKSKWW